MRLQAAFQGRVRKGVGVVSISRTAAGVLIRDAFGHTERFDHVVIATHADEGLALLEDADAKGAFPARLLSYTRNAAVLLFRPWPDAETPGHMVGLELCW